MKQRERADKIHLDAGNGKTACGKVDRQMTTITPGISCQICLIQVQKDREAYVRSIQLGVGK
jgi:hypothetical protein